MKTCKKCGGEEFYADGHCKPCQKAYVLSRTDYRPDRKEYFAEYRLKNKEQSAEYQAKYRKANAEKIKATIMKWAKENPHKRRAAVAKWRASNIEQAREYGRRYLARNHEKHRIKQQNRRALKTMNGGVLSKDISQRLLKLQRGKCACCGLPLGNDYHLDHILPLALGGSNTDDNIQLLRSLCNMQKSAKHPVDFMQQRGFLL